jgi:hypothetical protein
MDETDPEEEYDDETETSEDDEDDFDTSMFQPSLHPATGMMHGPRFITIHSVSRKNSIFQVVDNEHTVRRA